MHLNHLFAQVALTLLFATSAHGFWRMECRARSGLARIDPLVSNGTVSGHVHAIHGSSGFSDSASYDDLMAGDCTSCSVAEDKSAYWTPALYFKSATTGEFTLVEQVGGMLAYYLLYPNAGNSSLSAFPSQFQMIAGDTNQRNFTYPVPDLPKSDWTGVYETQAFLRQAALGFNCLNYAITPEGSLYRHFLPDKAYLDANCLDGVRFELMFPSCWNGVDYTSPDKKSHVAYPSQVMTGDCPDGFPERLPSLFYEIIWNTYAFAGQDGEFIIANGDPTGYGFHGDFLMGWDEKFLQDAVNTCTSASGLIGDCPLFTIQDSSVYGSCNITLPAAIENENVVSGMTALPGDGVIAYGPGYADGEAAGASPTTAAAKPTLGYSAGSSVASSGTYVPGAIFLASVSVSGAVEAAEVAMPTTTDAAPSTTMSYITTSAPAIPTSTADAQTFYSTSYSTAANGQVLEILYVVEDVTVTEWATSTTYVPGRKKRGLVRHQHGHKRF